MADAAIRLYHRGHELRLPREQSVNKATLDQIEALMSRLEAARRKVVAISESISRLREEEFGHDRHFASSSKFSMKLNHVGWAISGSSLTLDGSCDDQDCWYQIALDVVASVELTEDGAVIVERFEQHTERRSTIRFAK
jgi:hypothetical protein